MVKHLTIRRTTVTSFIVVSTVAIVGGLATWAAFPRLSLWWAAYVGLAALLFSVYQRAMWLTVWASLWWGILYMVPLTQWAQISVGWAVPWLALAFIQVLFMMAWAIVANIASRRITNYGVWLVIVAVLFAGMEQLRGHYPFGGFPWGYVAYTQVNAPFSAVIAYLGEVGTTTLMVIIAGMLAYLSQPATLKMKASTALVTVACVVLLTLVPLPHQKQDGSVAVALVQGNVERPVEATFEIPFKVLNNHVTMTKKAMAAGDADVVLWGEQAADQDYRMSPQAKMLLRNTSHAVDTPIVFGTLEYFDHHGKQVRTNDYAMVTPDGDFSVLYTKQNPVAFGEYVPMRDFLGKYFADVERIHTDMIAGHTPPTITINGHKVAVGICFEVAIDQVMYDGVRGGGSMIVVPTNNSSFGYSAESEQQLDMLRFRAIEYGRSAAQASINGVSAVVDADGSITQSTRLFVEDYIHADMPQYTHRTPASYWAAPASWWWGIGSSVLAVIIIIGAAVSRPHRKDRRDR